MTGPALDRSTIDRIDAASPENPIIVALSGGGDSIALLHGMAAHYGAPRLRAVVIDHALRAESGPEAARAASFAEALGIASSVIRLTWPEGQKRSQDTARRARYVALCSAARRVGACVIATGHTRDDQAETVLLRAQAGSAWRGLAGMSAFAPAPVWPEGRGLWLARPLLGARREALREALRAEWIEDPSNQNAKFARVRVRARLQALAESGLDPMRFAALAERLRVLADQIDMRAAALIAQAQVEGGEINLPLAALAGPREPAARALSAIIAAAAGAEREIGAEAALKLAARLGPSFRGATLGGAKLARRGEMLRFSRDLGALHGRAGGPAPLPPCDLPAGTSVVWDGRLALRAAESGWRAEIGAGADPILTKSEVRLPLSAAIGQGVAAATWLTRDRLLHSLGVHRAVTSVVAE